MGFIADKKKGGGRRTQQGGGGTIASRRVSRRPQASDSEEDTLTFTEMAQLAARRAGLEEDVRGIEREQKEEGLFEKTLEVLQMGEFAVGGIMSGKGPLDGIREEISPSDVLNIDNPVAGFAADVLLDPTTYLTFGIGSGAKIMTKAGSKILNKAGKKALKNSVEEFGQAGGRKVFEAGLLDEGAMLAKGVSTTDIVKGTATKAKEAIEKGNFEEVLNKRGVETLNGFVERHGEDVGVKMFQETFTSARNRYLGDSGMRVFGKKILPASTVKFPARAINKTIERVPFIGKPYKSAKDVLNRAFNPYKDIKEQLPEQGAAYISAFNQLQKGTRSAAIDAIEKSKQLAEETLVKFRRETGEDITREELGRRITREIEEGVPDASQTVQDAAEMITRQFEEIAETEQAAGVLGAAIPNYVRRFVTIDAREKMRKNPSLWNEFKEIRTRLGAAKERKIEGTIEEINKRWEDVNGFKLFEDDAFKALAGRTAESREALRQHRWFSNISHNFGAPARIREGGIDLGSEDLVEEAMPQIKKALSKFGVRDADASVIAREAAEQSGSLREVAQRLSDEFGLDGNQVLGEIDEAVLRAAKQADEGLRESVRVIDGVKYVRSTAEELDGVLLPEAIVKHVDQTTDIFASNEATRELLRAYDNVIGFWKGSVTSWFPAFHGRNFLGGFFNNWLAGVKSPKAYQEAASVLRGGDGVISTDVGDFSYRQIRELAHEHGVIGQPGRIDTAKKVDEMLKEVGESGVRRKGRKFKELPQKTMELVENNLRLPHFIDRLKKGDDPTSAAKSVFKYHFDYMPEGLTSFERNVMKRIMPFYRWTRGNVPLQLEQILKQPGKYAAIGKFSENIGQPLTDEDENVLPSYIKDGLFMTLEKKDGFAKILEGTGLPAEDINKLWRGNTQETISKIMAEFSPAITLPVQQATGMNLYFGSEVEDNDWAKPWVNEVPGLRTWLETTPYEKADGSTGYRVNPHKKQLLQNFIGRYWTTIGDVAEGFDEKNNAFHTLLQLSTGIQVRNVDLESQRYWRNREFQEELLEILDRKGVDVGQIPFIKSESKEELGLPTGRGSTRRTEQLIQQEGIEEPF